MKIAEVLTEGFWDNVRNFFTGSLIHMIFAGKTCTLTAANGKSLQFDETDSYILAKVFKEIAKSGYLAKRIKSAKDFKELGYALDDMNLVKFNDDEIYHLNRIIDRMIAHRGLD